MSDSDTPSPSPDQTATPVQTAAPAEPGPPVPNFDELRRKLLEQFSGLGEQVDTLQTKLAADLAQATAQARAVIEKEIATVKEQYPDAFNRLHELRDVGEEGWGVLRTRLDRLAGDLEKALGGFVTSLSDAVKRDGAAAAGSSLSPDASESPAAASESGSPAAADSAQAAQSSDKPSSAS